MQLTELIDLNERVGHDGSDIPCQESDAELWFAQVVITERVGAPIV